MTRESAEAKGRRYLGEGRLIVEYVDDRLIRATCRGGGAVYVLGHERDRWYCTCPALRRCGHLVALQLATRRPV
jgi:hypothetical protein